MHLPMPHTLISHHPGGESLPATAIQDPPAAAGGRTDSGHLAEKWLPGNSAISLGKENGFVRVAKNDSKCPPQSSEGKQQKAIEISDSMTVCKVPSQEAVSGSGMVFIVPAFQMKGTALGDPPQL